MSEREHRFTALYEGTYHRILGYACRRTGTDEAADVVAETFAVAWRRLDDVPAGDEALLWLYGTARRVLANQRRAERRRTALLEVLRRQPVPVPAPAAGGDVGEALGRLRDEDRELLLLVAWEGLDASAVAAVVDCSRNAARIRLHRARRRFAGALAESEPRLLTRASEMEETT